MNGMGRDSVRSGKDVTIGRWQVTIQLLLNLSDRSEDDEVEYGETRPYEAYRPWGYQPCDP